MTATPVTSPDHAITQLRGQLHSMPAFIAGSCVAAHVHGHASFHDIDVFVPSQGVLFTTIQRLLDQGYYLDDRFDRVWYRWQKYGLKGWHTNSMRLYSMSNIETNIVYKMVDGHPTTALSQVLESFDFGVVGVGYDLEQDTFRDIRPYLFPGYDPKTAGPLPMMPNKRDNWRRGFISQYNGMREAARLAKYTRYGYDMSLVIEDMVLGYRMAAIYLDNHFDDKKQLLGAIYTRIADLIELEDFDELETRYATFDFNDELDVIMDALE
jgi:hypothetical protein